jgi:DNA-binding HxlR family transcriptional regulator
MENRGVTDLHDCSIAASLSFVGDRWTLLILRDAFRGVRRFGDFCADLGIARNILADRLEKLVDAGIFAKVKYQDRPVRYEYRLTEKGRDLSPALVALMRWGDRWALEGDPPTLLVHDACGSELEQLLRCPECGVEVTPTHIRSRHPA